ncbi:tRNA(Ile)-lysidine synthetase, partial [hydrothermal vent metagenome]
MIEAFLKHIEKYDLYRPEEKILVAVSGGVDSVVMLHLLHRSGFRLAIAHCNFQLRGSESDGDESFVRNLAAQYGISVFVKSCDTRAFAEKGKISIEMAARRLRYDWFAEITEKYQFQKLSIGHNKGDDAETFFIKLLRGSGLSGLKGILAKRENIIRPLLFASRKEILAYAKEHQLPFREDSSNASDDYLRNRIRHRLLPFYEKEFPGATKALAESLEKLKTTETIFRQLLEEKKNQLFHRTDDEISLDKSAIRYLEPKADWLFFLLEDFGFNRSIIDDFCQTLESSQTGQLFHAENYTLLNDSNKLIIKKKRTVSEKEFTINDWGKPVSEPLQLTFEIFPNQPGFTFSTDKAVAYFDADKLSLPLKLRRWHHGDRFVPFGMKGSKLLSDFFVDEKINRFKRKNCWLLLSAKEIIWVTGHRASNRFRITGRTKSILKI